MGSLIPTKCWLCLVFSLALTVSALTSSIRAPEACNVDVCPITVAGNFALVCDGLRLVLTPAVPTRMSLDADDSEFDEEEECESSGSFSHLVCPAFSPSASPPSLLSRPCPGSSPPRIAAVPLRC